jgi:hypothetical protein
MALAARAFREVDERPRNVFGRHDRWHCVGRTSHSIAPLSKCGVSIA